MLSVATARTESPGRLAGALSTHLGLALVSLLVWAGVLVRQLGVF